MRRFLARHITNGEALVAFVVLVAAALYNQSRSYRQGQIDALALAWKAARGDRGGRADGPILHPTQVDSHIAGANGSQLSGGER